MVENKKYERPREYMYSHIEGDQNVYKSDDGEIEIRFPVDKSPTGILFTEEELLGKEMAENNDYERSREYMYSHIEGDQNVYKSDDGEIEIRFPVDKSPHGILFTEEELLGKEDEPHISPKVGASTVPTSIIRETRDCSYVQQAPVIENMTSDTYEEVVYEVCSECGNRREISRTIVEHPYVDGPAKLNEDGTYSVTRIYTDPSGEGYSVEIAVNGSENSAEYVSEETPSKHR